MRPLLAALLVLATTCSDANGPGRMTLAFEPSQITRTGLRLPEGRMSCEIEPTIQAHGGTATTSLLLLQITNTFFDSVGNRGNTTFSVPGDWFGSDRLGYNERLVAHRTANGPGPYSIKIALLYHAPDGADPIDTLSVSCQ